MNFFIASRINAALWVVWAIATIGLSGGNRTFEEQALLDTTPLVVFWYVTVKRIWPLVLLSGLWMMLVDFVCFLLGRVGFCLTKWQMSSCHS